MRVSLQAGHDSEPRSGGNQPPDRRGDGRDDGVDSLSTRGAWWLWAAAALLAVQAITTVAFGSWCAWQRKADIDMALRAAEHALFRQGIYPNGWLERPPVGVTPVYTVYPPYAFPLCAFFFEPGGLPRGRFLIESLSIAAMAVMGVFAFRTLVPHGRAIAWMGAFCGAAIASNGTALALGQFSILCMGLLVQQIIFLDRGRPLAAGVCWAVAMIKPQIALPFLVLFPMVRQTSGGLCGLAVLVMLSAAACLWTGVSPSAMIDHWGRGMSLQFIGHGGGIGPGSLVIPKRVLMGFSFHENLQAAAWLTAAVPVAWEIWRTSRMSTSHLVPATGRPDEQPAARPL